MNGSKWHAKVRQRLSLLGLVALALLLIGCNAPSGQTTTSGGVTLTVTPTHARRGEVITLSGQAWHPNSKITLAFSLTSQQSNDATRLGSTVSDAQGKFTFVAVVPQAAQPGVWSIIVQGDVDQSASAFFTVEDGPATAATTSTPVTPTPVPTETPSPTELVLPTDTPVPTEPPMPTATSTSAPVALSKADKPAAQPVLQAVWNANRLNVYGEGWPSGAQVQLMLSRREDGDGAVVLSTLKANDQGQFSILVALPRQAREGWFIIASDGSQRVAVRLTRAPGR
jgi:hypothetical protein